MLNPNVDKFLAIACKQEAIGNGPMAEVALRRALKIAEEEGDGKDSNKS